jgi:hypothetical protein
MGRASLNALKAFECAARLESLTQAAGACQATGPSADLPMIGVQSSPLSLGGVARAEGHSCGA